MEQIKNGRDKRRDERIEDISLTENDTMRIYDFSEGGIGIYLNSEYKQDTVLLLKISVGELKHITKVKVAHCSVSGKRYRTGFKYDNLKENEKDIIRQMVDLYSRGVPVYAEFHT